MRLTINGKKYDFGRAVALATERREDSGGDYRLCLVQRKRAKDFFLLRISNVEGKRSWGERIDTEQAKILYRELPIRWLSVEEIFGES